MPHPPRSILVTGGTGSFGRAFIHRALAMPSVQRVVIYSRDELKQYEMASEPRFAAHADRLRFFIGDVRDAPRLQRAVVGVDTIVHAAALKQVPAAEYNPFEAIKTNVLGGQNVIDAALAGEVERVVALSTDKAAAPINLYGATKLASDKLFVAANNHRGSRDIRFSVVRYGNVMGSRGSVIPFFKKVAQTDAPIPITDPRMTRFNITIDEGVDMVVDALERMWGGEIFVPRIPSYRVVDVAEAIAPGREQLVVGLRPGEKVDEQMITKTDALGTIDFGTYFVILPSTDQWSVEEFMADAGPERGVRVARDFEYDSGSNPHFLDVGEIRELIKKLGL